MSVFLVTITCITIVYIIFISHIYYESALYLTINCIKSITITIIIIIVILIIVPICNAPGAFSELPVALVSGCDSPEAMEESPVPSASPPASSVSSVVQVR